MTRYRTCLLVAVLSMAAAFPGATVRAGSGIGAERDAVAEAEDGDPGLTLYKSGYSAILAEQWAKARKSFAELLKSFPKSAYADDARYWSAYAQMHLDKGKAVAEYREFINRHPRSSYVSDAVADLGNLEQKMMMFHLQQQLKDMTKHAGQTASAAAEQERARLEDLQQRLRTGMIPPLPPMTHPGSDSAFHRFRFWDQENKFDIGQMDMRGFALNMKRLGWKMRRMFRSESATNLDKETRLRLEALTALGQGEETEKSFQTLKNIAVDRSQPDVLRLEAMDQLAGFRKHDAAPVLLQIAKTDSNEEIQSESLDLLRDCIKDKNASVHTYGVLYRSLPESRIDQRSMILYEIADIGNDPAVDFLSDVARHDSSYDLRSEAVYYLGSIGGPKARDVLYDVLQNK